MSLLSLFLGPMRLLLPMLAAPPLGEWPPAPALEALRQAPAQRRTEPRGLGLRMGGTPPNMTLGGRSNPSASVLERVTYSRPRPPTDYSLDVTDRWNAMRVLYGLTRNAECKS